MICSSDNGSLRLSFKYSMSLYAIDLIIPLVIQFDILCLCLLNLIVLEGKCLFIALVMVCSRTSLLEFGSALGDLLKRLYKFELENYTVNLTILLAVD